jgi:thioredoxin-like negative regulator of GroEL
MKMILSYKLSSCNSCKKLAKKIQELNTDISIEVCDVDEYPNVLRDCYIGGVPTLIMIKDHKEVKRLVGNVSMKELKEWVEND